MICGLRSTVHRTKRGFCLGGRCGFWWSAIKWREGHLLGIETDPQLAICGEAVMQGCRGKGGGAPPGHRDYGHWRARPEWPGSRHRDQAPGSRSRNRDREPARGSPNGSAGISRRRPRLYLKIKRHHRPAPSHRPATRGERFLQVPGLANRSQELDPHEILQRSPVDEKTLHESEERFRCAMNSTAEGLYTLDTQEGHLRQFLGGDDVRLDFRRIAGEKDARCHPLQAPGRHAVPRLPVPRFAGSGERGPTPGP